jgi:hypothetical protein
MKVYLTAVARSNYFDFTQHNTSETRYTFANRDVELQIVSKELDKIIDVQDFGDGEFDMEINISYKPKPKTIKIK